MSATTNHALVLREMSVEIDPRLVDAMKAIARGRTNGLPLKAEDGRQVMRTAMASCGMDW